VLLLLIDELHRERYRLVRHDKQQIFEEAENVIPMEDQTLHHVLRLKHIQPWMLHLPRGQLNFTTRQYSKIIYLHVVTWIWMLKCVSDFAPQIYPSVVGLEH